MPFELFDTGGLYGASEDPLHDLVVRQGQRAVAGAQLLVLVVDGREGLVPADQEIAADLRQAGRRVILAINKADDKRARDATLDFYRLGLRTGVRDFRGTRAGCRRSARRDREAIGGARCRDGGRAEPALDRQPR